MALFVLALSTASMIPSAAIAHHAWGTYHWARTSNPLVLKFGSSVPPEWEPYLKRAVMDWNRSSVIDAAVVPGKANPKSCKSRFGMVEVCVAEYGETRWLGIVHIWVSNGHIIHGVVKINDTHFKKEQFNKPAWKYEIMCHEIGHVLGLDHQDTDLWNTPLGSCMDYSEDPTLNQRPNKHDYEVLEEIYSHLDTTTVAGTTTVIVDSPGMLISKFIWAED